MRRGCAVLALLVAGCGSSAGNEADAGGGREAGGSGGSGGGGRGGSSGGGGASGSGGTESPCGLPGARVIAAPAVYNSGYPVSRLAVDGDRAFFVSRTEIHSVPIAGGEPTLVYPPEPLTRTVYPLFWILGDELIVGLEIRLEIVPKTGGTAIRSLDLPTPYASSPDGPVHMLLVPGERAFYGKYDAALAAPNITYFHYSLDTGASRTLLSDTRLGYQARMLLHGEYLYTAEHVGDPMATYDATPDTIHRIPIVGGAAQPVPVTGAFRIELMGADDESLYFAGRPAPFEVDIDPGGLYRIPLAGGAPERVVETYVTAIEFVRFARLEGRHVVWSQRDFYELPDAGEGRLLFTTSCAVHAFAATESDVYVSTHDELDGTLQVLRVPLP